MSYNPSAGAGKISTSGDVTLTSPQTGQVLTYDGSIARWKNADSNPGVTDHGNLTGLGDDDHTQYHTDARGDARYYVKGQVDTLVSGRVAVSDSRLSDQRTPLDNSVTGVKLVDNAVVTAKLAGSSVTAPKLNTSVAPTTGQVLSYSGTSLAWTTLNVTDPTLGGDLGGTASNAQINAGAVTATELGSGAVTTVKIADNNVTGAKLTSSSITNAKIATGAVSTDRLSTPAAPSTGQVLSYNGSTLIWTSPSTVPTTLDDLNDVVTTAVSDGQALTYHSGTGKWSPATIGTGGGVTDHGALTGLGDDDHTQYHTDARGDARYYVKGQVDTLLSAKIDNSDARLNDTRTPTDGSVATAKIASSAVTTAKIADATITSVKIATNAIGTTQLIDNTVTEPKLNVSNTPTGGQVLSYNGTNLEWISPSIASATITSTQKSADYTLALADAGTVVEVNVTSAATVTIPPNSAVAFPIGTIIEVYQLSNGQITIAAGTGVTIRSPGGLTNTRVQYSTLSMRQRATNVWVLSGDMD